VADAAEKGEHVGAGGAAHGTARKLAWAKAKVRLAQQRRAERFVWGDDDGLTIVSPGDE